MGTANGSIVARLVVFGVAFCTHAAVIDRVAVVVGNQVITETEVADEVRLTAFLNQQTLDLGPEQRRAAADRLVDQQLIRNEMQLGSYAAPAESEVESTLRNFRQEHFNSISRYRAALQKYGITEEQLKEHLMWQLAALRFTDIRFRAAAALPPSNGQTANRLQSEGEATSASTVDQQMETWLKEARGQTRVEFKKEAFQ
ncbi:MAG: hypothetical protein C5B51_20465 [Terriglobia bacterium]|nr:MAG: hypothetical protein C5B51_20465 [Terriglobia bacterium]